MGRRNADEIRTMRRAGRVELEQVSLDELDQDIADVHVRFGQLDDRASGVGQEGTLEHRHLGQRLLG